MTPPPGGAGAAIMDTIGAPLDAAVAGMRGPPRNPMFPPVQGPPMPPEPPVQGPPMQSPIAAANPALQPTQSTALDELLRKLWAGGRSGRSAPAGLGDLAGD